MSVEILHYISFGDRVQLWNTNSEWRRYIKIYTKRRQVGECVLILDPSKHDKSGAKIKYPGVIVQVDVDNDRVRVHYNSCFLKGNNIPEPQNKWIKFHGGYLSQWIWDKLQSPDRYFK